MAKYAQGMATSNEANGIQLLYDGDGLAVIGEPAAVENFLAPSFFHSLLSNDSPSSSIENDDNDRFESNSKAGIQAFSCQTDSICLLK